MRAAFTLAAAALLTALAGCSSIAPPAPVSTPAARCAASPVQLLEPTPLFTGPQAGAALDRGLAKGQAVVLCGEQGQRRQVLLPRQGQRCTSPSSCAGGWIARGTRTGPAP